MPRMWRLQIIICFAIFLFFVETNSSPIRRFKTTVTTANIIKREIRDVDLKNYPVPPTPLPSNKASNELSHLPFNEKELFKGDVPQPSPPLTTSTVAGELPHTTEITESRTQGISRDKQALRDLDNFEKALADFLNKVQGSPTTETPTPSNLRPASENLNKFNTTEATVVQQKQQQLGNLPETRADFEFGSEKQHEKANEPFLRGANLNAPKMIQTSNNGSTVQMPLTRDAVPPSSLQEKMKDPTAIKEPANRSTEQFGQQVAPSSEYIPSGNFKPYVEDNTKQKSSELPNKSPQGLQERENKPLFGTREEIALGKVMEKARNMPLEYDDSKSFLGPEHHEKLSEKNLKLQYDKILNKDLMKEDKSRASTRPSPVEFNVLRPKYLPFKDDVKKSKLLPRFP